MINEKIFSKFKTVKSDSNVHIGISQYIEEVKNGNHQEIIFKARSIRSNKDEYNKIKLQLPAITGSCTIKNNSRHSSANIEKLNGLILIDIDEEVSGDLRKEIEQDKYIYISNRSVSGVGLVCFIKINSDLFTESFHSIGQYFSDNFNVDIDQSCKNPNRLRFLSYDPDIFINESSHVFKAKKAPKEKKSKETFYFIKDDFTYIIDQLQAQNIDLCQDDYKRFCDIGFAIGSQFGSSGLDYFKAVCQIGSKYNPERIEKQYSKFCQKGSITISTFYYFAREAGCELYSEKSKQIIKRVAVGKANNTIMTPESVIETLEILGVEAGEDDKPFIKSLIDSKENLAKNIENEENETVRLDNFIKENYPIKKNNFNQLYEYKNEPINDEIINTIVVHAKKYFDFKLSATDVSQLIFNSKINTYDPLIDYFKNNDSECTGKEIHEYAAFIKPYNEFNKWALTKWLVGAIHNWISNEDHEEVSPLVLVLCGKQASGKTSFFRNMLPPELRRYFIDESMEEGGKDVLKRMATSMIMLNDEFGGMAGKDVKNFKKITEKNKITIRLPYGRLDVDLKRRTMLCGTTNDSSVLKDETGNRRILPIEFDGVDYEGAKDFDKHALLKCAYDLYKSDFDFRLFSKEDIDYLNENTTQNLEIEVSEDLFFTKFRFEQCHEFSERTVMNQGEVCNYMNANFAVQISKYDIKRIFMKHKMDIKSYSYLGKTKKGYEMFGKFSAENAQEVPF